MECKRTRLAISAVALGLLGATLAAADSVFSIDNPPLDYEVIDAYPFDGFGDFGPFGDSTSVLLGWSGEAREVVEFDISPFTVPPGEHISTAICQFYIQSIEVAGMGVPWGVNPSSVSIHGYAGDGIVSVSDFEAGDGNFLDRVLLPAPYVGQQLTFDVTAFVTELVTAGQPFVGVTVRADDFGGIALFEGPGSPKLTINTEVPEPGALALLALAGLLLARKRCR